VRRALVGLTVAAGLLLGTAAATAGDVTGRDKGGDVTAAGLTRAERDAIDIVSVHVVGEEGLGVVVVVTFRGNVEKALGRGHLKQGLVAVILQAKSSSQKPAALATRGTSKSAVLRKTRSEQVGAVRNGRTITFFIGGGGFSSVARIDVRSFANLPLGSSRRLSAEPPPQLTDEEFKKVATFANLDKLVVLADAQRLTCQQLETLNKSALFVIQALVHSDFSEGRDPQFDRDLLPWQAFQVAIKTRLDDQCKGLPKTPEAEFAWTFFGTSKNEVTGKGAFGELSGRKITAITIRVPEHKIDAALCPEQLPNLSFPAPDTIRCDGGTLGGEEFTANVRVSPDPTTAMGGELTAFLDDGSTIGPFPITGP
jgi:hypothetical protein